MATRRRSRYGSVTGMLTDTQRRLRYLESRPSYSRLAAQVVKKANIRPKSVGSDQIEDLSIDNKLIGTDEVTNRNLANNSVTTDNIAPGNVTNPTIGSGAVSTDKIADNAVTTAKIADSAVTTAKINSLAVTTEKINNSAVTNAKLADTSVSTGKLQDSAVSNSKIANGSVDSNKLADNSVINSKIEDNAVTETKINQGSVTTLKIATRAVTGIKIDEDAVTTGKIADLNVTNSKIAAGAITTSKIGNSEISREKLSFNTVTRVDAGFGISVSGGAGSTPSIAANIDTLDNRYASRGHGHFAVNSGKPIIPENQTFQDHIHSVSISSRKFKKDITDYDFDTSKLLRLTLKRFKLLNSVKNLSKNTEWEFGYIVEDLEDDGFLEPLAFDSDGNANRIDYPLIGILTLELVKEQQKRIEKLEQTISEMGAAT